MPNLNLKSRLYPHYWQFIERYLNKRQSPAEKVTLVQKLIFILPTRYGWWFLFLIGLLYLLGTNYQNNLILLVSYLLLSVFLLSIVLTYQNLSGLTVQCPSSAEGFATDKVHPVISFSSAKMHYMLQLNLMPHYDTVQLTDTSQNATLSLTGAKRGCYLLPRLKITSQYPLGLWRAWSYIALRQHYWVYPAPDSNTALHPAADEPAVPAGNNIGDTLTSYRSGESMRHIVWKRLAQNPTNPVVREQQQHNITEPEWVIVPPLSGDALEHALRRACQQLLTLENGGKHYGLKLPTVTVQQAQGALHLQRCLQELALC